MICFLLLIDFTPYYFIHYSDPQIGRNAYTVPHCSIAVSQIMAMTPVPSFIIITGDMGEDPTNQNVILNQWRICDSLFDLLAVPKYFTPGNHDIGYANDNYWTPAMLAFYRNFWGMDYYATIYDSSLFVSLNSTLLDTYSGHSCYPYSLEQDSFLRTILEGASNTYKHIFLFFHFPLYISSPTEANSQNNVDRPRRDTLLKYLRDYNITAVFTGHLHYDLLNFYGPSLLMTALPTCETNINSCGYRVVKVYENGIETFVVYLNSPISTVSMNKIVQAEVQSDTLYVNIPFPFSCFVDTMNYPQWQGAIKRWIFRTGDTLYLPSGSYTFSDTGHYQILCQVYKSPHYAAIYRFRVYVRSSVGCGEITPRGEVSAVEFCNTMGTKIVIFNKGSTQNFRISVYSVAGQRFVIYNGRLGRGKNQLEFPAFLSPGVYFIRIQTRDGDKFYKFIYPGEECRAGF
ncbi:MAG: metallophosphoesterase [candidate division WOR-3 bacterium]